MTKSHKPSSEKKFNPVFRFFLIVSLIVFLAYMAYIIFSICYAYNQSFLVGLLAFLAFTALFLFVVFHPKKDN